MELKHCSYSWCILGSRLYKVKLNISFPAPGCQKLIDMDNDWKLCVFYEKRKATEGVADALDEE